MNDYRGCNSTQRKSDVERPIYSYHEQDKQIEYNFESNQSSVQRLQQSNSNIDYNVIEEEGVSFLGFPVSDTPVYTDTLYHNDILNGNIDSGAISKEKDTTKKTKGKKTRRRLNWRFGPIQKRKPKKPVVSQSDDGCDQSISGDSLSKSVMSVHTFHSVATEVQTNNNNNKWKNKMKQYNSKARNIENEGLITTINDDGTLALYDTRDDEIDQANMHNNIEIEYTKSNTYVVNDRFPPITPESCHQIKSSSSQKRFEFDDFKLDEELDGCLSHTPHYVDSSSNTDSNSTGLPPLSPKFVNSCAAKHDQIFTAKKYFSNENSNHADNQSSHHNMLSSIDEGVNDESEDPSRQLARLQAMAEAPLEPSSPMQSLTVSQSHIQNIEKERNLIAEGNLKAMHRLGQKHLKHGEYNEALEVFEEICRAQQEMHGNESSRVGTALQNIAIVHIRAGDHDRAIATCQNAIDVRRKALGSNHPDLAASLAQLGVVLLEINQYKVALHAFYQSLSIRRKALNRSDPRVARLLNNIGCCLHEIGQLEGAILAFDEALDIQREVMRTMTPGKVCERNGRNNVNNLLLTIAATLCNIGSLKLRCKLYDDSLIMLEEALIIQESVLGEDNTAVLNTKGCIDFVNSMKDKHHENMFLNDNVGDKMVIHNSILEYPSNSKTYPDASPLNVINVVNVTENSNRCDLSRAFCKSSIFLGWFVNTNDEGVSTTQQDCSPRVDTTSNIPIEEKPVMTIKDKNENESLNAKLCDSNKKKLIWI